MNRFLLSVALLFGLLGSAFGQSISSSPGSAAGVIGPSGAPAPGTVTDNAVVRWDGTTGTLVQDSRAILTDTGSLRLGGADAAAPATILLDFQGVVAGTANTAGPNVTIAAPVSTGSAAGGSIIFQTAAAGGAGSGQNALATRWSITGAGNLAVGLNNAYDIGTTSALVANIYSVQHFSGNSYFNTNGFRAGSAGFFEFADDTYLYRDAANTLALRNSTTAQTFNVYETWTDASNYSRLTLTAYSGGADILVNKAGTGSGGTLNIGTRTAASLAVWTNNVNIWNFNSSGHLLTATDNAYDIGASGATRPRSIYAGSLIRGEAAIRTAASGYLDWNGRTNLTEQGDGNIRLANGAENSFGRLQFGGTTSSFPAIARNGIKLEAKLADDSTYASFAARGLIVAGAVPTLALAGGTCAGTVIAGGSTAGTVTLTGVCVATNTMALTVMPTAPTGYACDAIDRTLGSSLLTETATTTTSVTFTFGGTTGATDVLAYKCIAY